MLGQAERQGLFLDQLVVVRHGVLVVDLDGVFRLGRILRFTRRTGHDLLPDILHLILVLILILVLVLILELKLMLVRMGMGMGMLVAVLLVVLIDAIAVQLDVAILVRGRGERGLQQLGLEAGRGQVGALVLVLDLLLVVRRGELLPRERIDEDRMLLQVLLERALLRLENRVLIMRVQHIGDGVLGGVRQIVQIVRAQLGLCLQIDVNAATLTTRLANHILGHRMAGGLLVLPILGIVQLLVGEVVQMGVYGASAVVLVPHIGRVIILKIWLGRVDGMAIPRIEAQHRSHDGCNCEWVCKSIRLRPRPSSPFVSKVILKY